MVLVMVKSKRQQVLDVVKSLNKHKGKKGMSVGEICNATGLFPSDVEATLKELKESKVAECYIYKGKLYAIIKSGSIISAVTKVKEKAAEKATELRMHG